MKVCYQWQARKDGEDVTGVLLMEQPAVPRVGDLVHVDAEVPPRLVSEVRWYLATGYVQVFLTKELSSRTQTSSGAQRADRST